MDNIIVFLMAIVSAVVLLVGISLIMALPIMWCWNYAVVAIWGLPKITWGMAWCLSFLSGCFIKSTQTNNNKS